MRNIDMEVEIYVSEQTGEKILWIGDKTGSGWEEPVNPEKIGEAFQRYLESYHPEIM